MLRITAQFWHSDSGSTAIEYGLISALIAVGAILAITFFGNSLSGLFNHVSSRSSNAMGS